MDEYGLKELITHVKAGRLSRRGFVQMMVGLGLTAPMAAQMLASAGVAQAQSKLVYKPTKRGGGGALKTLWWQGATLLNPYFAVGTKDQDGSRIFYEPLASWEAASKENKWQGRNITRWRNEEYDRIFRSAESEMDPVKRAALFIKMNDLVIQNVVVIPVVWRNGQSAAATKLQGLELSGWDSTLWRLSHWYRQA